MRGIRERVLQNVPRLLQHWMLPGHDQQLVWLCLPCCLRYEAAVATALGGLQRRMPVVSFHALAHHRIYSAYEHHSDQLVVRRQWQRGLPLLQGR